MRTRAPRCAAQSGITLRSFAGPDGGPWWGQRPAECEDGEQVSSDTKLRLALTQRRACRQGAWTPLTGKSSCEAHHSVDEPSSAAPQPHDNGGNYHQGPELAQGYYGLEKL